jgi:hypothetical protein
MSMNFQEPRAQVSDTNGKPMAGAKLRFYEPGTTTPRAVYSDDGLSTAITQPVIADSAGRFAQIFLQTGTYRVKLFTSSDVLVYDEDDCDPSLSTNAGALAIANGGTGATTAAGARSNLDVPSQSAFDSLEVRVDDLEAEAALPQIALATVQTYAASFTPVFTTFETLQVTLTGNVTFNAPTVTDGQTVRLYIIQDATGSRLGTWNSAWHFPNGIVPLLSTTAGAVDELVGHVRGSVIMVESFNRQDAMGNVLQVQYTRLTAVATGTTTIPADDTIPQNTEGTEFITVTITPRSATSKLLIEFTGIAGVSADAGRVTALFQDSTANALSAVYDQFDTDAAWDLTAKLTHAMTSGTTSSTTFKIRIGGASASTITFNGRASARLFGGVAGSILKVTEIAG